MCQQEIGIHMLSSLNHMDPGSQPQVLANLTQVEEMLIAWVSPILQVTHANSGQYKYERHTIYFPQYVEVSKVSPHAIDKLPIIIMCRRDQCATYYNFTINKECVYISLR